MEQSAIHRRDFWKKYRKPFQACIRESNLLGIMPCYCTINGEPASASHKILTELKRKEMGFTGLCFSDYGAVGNTHGSQHVGETFQEAGLMCLKAGMDIELPNQKDLEKKLQELFREGKADIHVLDQAVLCIDCKVSYRLFENPYSLQGEELKRVFMNPADREVSLQSAKESLVLLKNNGVLPIKTALKKLRSLDPMQTMPENFLMDIHICMMESTYAMANSIAGVSGIRNVDPKDIVTVPGTNIQSDETEEFDAILRRQKPQCRSLLEELRAKLPGKEIHYSMGITLQERIKVILMKL